MFRFVCCRFSFVVVVVVVVDSDVVVGLFVVVDVFEYPTNIIEMEGKPRIQTRM